MALDGETNATHNENALSHKDKQQLKFYEKVKESKAKRRKKVMLPRQEFLA